MLEMPIVCERCGYFIRFGSLSYFDKVELSVCDICAKKEWEDHEKRQAMYE